MGWCRSGGRWLGMTQCNPARGQQQAQLYLWRSSADRLPLPHHAHSGMSIPAHVSQNQAVTFVRLVNQSKGSGTDQLAFDEPQLGRRCPVGEEPPAPAHDVGQH